MDAMRADPRNKVNNHITLATKREAIKDYYDRRKMLETMQREADDEGDWEYEGEKAELGLLLGGGKHKHKHHSKRRRKSHRRKSHKRKSHRRKNKTRRR